MVATREHRLLHYLNLQSLEVSSIPISTECSNSRLFCIVDIAVSPCGRQLLLATDADTVLVCDARGAPVLAHLHGANNDKYSTPRCAWGSAACRRVYCTSQDSSIVVWEFPDCKTLSSQLLHMQPFCKLRGHFACVRDLHSDKLCLLSCSYDSSIVF